MLTLMIPKPRGTFLYIIWMALNMPPVSGDWDEDPGPEPHFLDLLLFAPFLQLGRASSSLSSAGS